MLKLTVPGTEFWDETKEEFVQIKPQELLLEHSLLSISKWESKWHKSFLSQRNLTVEEILDYIRCMIVSPKGDTEAYRCLTNADIERIKQYISDPMTATYFSNPPNGKKSAEAITSELIYYWMVAYQIPFECEKWFLNRLLTLIRVCEVKNKPAKKMSPHAIRKQNAALNAARRKRLHSRG